MKTKTIEYGIKEIATNKIRGKFETEYEAIEFAAKINKKANDELLTVVKIITTITIE